MAHAGGTLDGITARLDHLAALGVDLVYLTPVVRAPSNHKYDAESFDEVDARFGGRRRAHAAPGRSGQATADQRQENEAAQGGNGGGHDDHGPGNMSSPILCSNLIAV